jgi:hypothetical protein
MGLSVKQLHLRTGVFAALSVLTPQRWMRPLVVVLLFTVLLGACGPSVRQLTPKEANVRIVPEGPEWIAKLEEENCLAVGAALNAPTSAGMSPSQEFRALIPGAMECAPGLDTVDDLRRCAGEHQAQAVQITGFRIDRKPDWDGLANALANGLDPFTIVTEGRAVKRVVVSHDLLFWRCPASRAVPVKGELVLHRRSGTNLQLLRDGQVVIKDFNPTELPPLVTAHPPAAEMAARAAKRERAVAVRAYATLPFAALALAGGALAVVGAVKHNPWYTYGGLGGAVVFTSVAVGIAMSARKPHFEAMTLSMTAIDLYNDVYIHEQKNNLSE